MLISVYRKRSEEQEFLCTVDCPQVPSIGDGFWWETHGPFTVLDLTWHFPMGYQKDRPEVATIVVEEDPLQKAGYIMENAEPAGGAKSYVRMTSDARDHVILENLHTTRSIIVKIETIRRDETFPLKDTKHYIDEYTLARSGRAIAFDLRAC